MPRIKSKETERFWREIVNRQASSGQSVSKFCRAEGISEPSFYTWRKRLRGAGHEAAPVASCHSKLSQEPLFLPLGVLGGESTLEVIHPAGCRIRVIGAVNPDSLRLALRVLDERGAR